jgi:hypothetical protein
MPESWVSKFNLILFSPNFVVLQKYLIQLVFYQRGLQTPTLSKYVKGNSPKFGLYATPDSQAIGAQERSHAMRLGKRKDDAQRYQFDQAVHYLQ